MNGYVCGLWCSANRVYIYTSTKVIKMTSMFWGHPFFLKDNFEHRIFFGGYFRYRKPALSVYLYAHMQSLTHQAVWHVLSWTWLLLVVLFLLFCVCVTNNLVLNAWLLLRLCQQVNVLHAGHSHVFENFKITKKDFLIHNSSLYTTGTIVL